MAGNKNSGRRKMDVEAREFLLREAPEALKRIRALAFDKKAPKSVRLSANQYLCDRAWGKPSQAIQHSGDADNPVVVEWIVGKGYAGDKT
jgi:hypothetical protein